MNDVANKANAAGISLIDPEFFLQDCYWYYLNCLLTWNISAYIKCEISLPTTTRTTITTTQSDPDVGLWRSRFWHDIQSLNIQQMTSNIRHLTRAVMRVASFCSRFLFYCIAC